MYFIVDDTIHIKWNPNVMVTSTLDLPYTLPKEKDRSEPAIAAEPSRRIKKSRAPPKSKYL